MMIFLLTSMLHKLPTIHVSTSSNESALQTLTSLQWCLNNCKLKYKFVSCCKKSQTPINDWEEKIEFIYHISPINNQRSIKYKGIEYWNLFKHKYNSHSIYKGF